MKVLDEYLKHCRKFLVGFEQAQEEMLRLNVEEARASFKELISEIRSQFQQALSHLRETDRHSFVFLLRKQIQLLEKYLLRMEKDLADLSQSAQLTESIIAAFDKQYRFKRVLKKHLADTEQFLSGREK